MAAKSNIEQYALAVCGVAVFVVGASVHRNRASLAVALVVLGVVMFVLAILLPRLKSLSANVTGIGEISLALTPTTSAVSDQALADPTLPAADLRGADPHGSRKGAFQQAVTGGPATYVVINLEEGKSWLTSRLYLFVDVLAEVRGIDAVVFTTRVNGANAFVGLCSVDSVLRRLGWAFPWLPMKLGVAWSQVRRGDGHRPPARRLSVHQAAELYSTYVRSLQLWESDPLTPPAISASRPAAALPYPSTSPALLDPRSLPPGNSPAPPQEWQEIGGVWEHANWIDAAFLKEILGEALSNESVTSTDDTPELARAVSNARAKYIAVLNDRNEVQSLIDRYKVLAQASAVRS